MLEIGINNCDPQYSILLRTFFWTLKLTIAMSEEARTEAYLEMKRLQKEFDTPECHEMVAQVRHGINLKSLQATVVMLKFKS